jgi:hypothetical protein
LTYDDKILRFLTEAGSDGLSVRKLARHVFNASNTLFETVDFEEVHRYVQTFLLRNSRSSDSLVENVGKRGIYRLNPRSARSQQLMLMFSEEEEPEEAPKPAVDLSLSLF